MRIRTIGPVVLACALGRSAEAQYLQWTVDSTTNHWYGLTASMPWSAAEAVAQSQGGHLVTIGSAAEHDWIRQQLLPLPPWSYWIGLNDIAVEGTFEWASGEPVTYANWASGEPDNGGGVGDAVVLWQYAALQWNDIYASVTMYPGLVERGPRPVAGWSFPAYGATGSAPLDLDTGDLDGDARPDIVVANSGSVSVFLTQNDGTLGAPSHVSGVSHAVVLGHFTADARLDAAAGAGATLRILVNDGSGGLVPGLTLATPGWVWALDHADVDGDLDDDLIATTAVSGSERLVVFRSNGDGTFAAADSYATVLSPFSVTRGDVDLDGDADLVVAGEYYNSSFAVYLNAGDGTFAALPFVSFGAYGGRAAIADFNRDGIQDLALPSNSFTKLAWGIGDGTFDMSAPTLPIGGYDGWAEAADLDGDGHTDLAVVAQQGTIVRVLLNRPGGNLVPTASLLFATWATCVRAIDLAGDCRPELVATDRNNDRVAVFRNLTLDCNANEVDDPTDIFIEPSLDADVDGFIDACESAGAPYCFGDGTGTPCPCGPSQAGGPGHGCATSWGTSAVLAATGNASVSADTVTLRASDLPPSTIGLFFQGDATQSGGAGAVFGDGLRCVTQGVVRLAIRAFNGGEASFGHGMSGDPSVSAAGSVPALGATRFYQLWYRDAAPFCTSATFNLTNGVRIDWRM